MKRIITTATATTVLALSMSGIAHAAPSSLKSCSQVQAAAPFGVSRDAKSAAAATKAGFVAPSINKALYARAVGLDTKKRRGFVCTTTVATARQANASGFFQGYGSNDPNTVLAGSPFAVADSPAAKYLQYLSRSTEAQTWDAFGSEGLVVPTAAPSTVTVAGDTITVTRGTEITAYTATFDPVGTLITWSTTVGPLADRLFAVQGTGSGYGMSVTVDWNYRSQLGQVITTGRVTNTSGRPLLLNTATYTGPDGVNYPGWASSGCLANGQSVPIRMATKGSAPSDATGKWQIQVLDCDYYDTGYIDLPFTAKS